ncbi:MAG: terminase [Piscirickettsiaceae bacterium]|nr:terminase [Piscirickettsiaceae bacterium]
MKVNTLSQSIRLALHPGQAEVFNYRSRFKVVVAGRRWGKTQLAKTAIVNAAKIQKRLIWYVAPTYRMAKQIMWQELLDSFPRKWVKKLNETSMTIWLVNGTIVELKGADKPDSLRGVGLHYVVLDEFQDMRAEVWSLVLRPTLASTGGHALFIGTPKSYNHLYEVWTLGQKDELRKAGMWASWQFPTIMSPFIPAAEIEAARADMDEKSFKQEFEASFETMSGRVYHAFDRNLHVGRYDFNPTLPIWIGQDFNIDPMSTVILQPQLNGELWAVGELVLFGSNTEEVCNELERRFWRKLKQVTVYPDPAGGWTQHARGETDLDIFREKGFKRIKHRRKHPKIADRVNAVNRMLKSGNGDIKFKVDRGCKFLIDSLEQTIYKPGTRDVDKTMNIEHSTDAIGYPIELEYPVRKVQIIGVSL